MNFNNLRRAVAGIVIAAPLAGIPLASLAQTAAPAAAPSAAAPAAPVAVTPEARAAIKELLDAMKTREALTQAYGAIAQTLAPRMGEGMNRQIEAYPGLSPEQRRQVREGMNPPFEAAVKEAGTILTNPKLVDDTIDKMYAIYASHFTTAEVKQLTAFYRTPVGNKTLTTMPAVNSETLQAGAQIFSPKVNAIMEATVKKQADAVLAGGTAPAAPAKAPAKK